MKQTKPLIPGLSRRTSIRYGVSCAIRFFKSGIGRSRRELKKRFGYSPFIHSYETLERYVGIINNFCDTVLTDAKAIRHIKSHHVETHFQNLLERNVTEKTIRVNASALIKLFLVFGRTDLVDYIDERRQSWVVEARPSGRTTPFTDPERVISKMRRDELKAMAKIQLLTGARVSDIKKVVAWVTENTDSYLVLIRKSKGGRDRVIDYADRRDTFEEIRQACLSLKQFIDSTQKDWASLQIEYTEEVHLSAKKCEEIYCGTHAFRANYAERRYLELQGKSLLHGNDKEILKIITEELGHLRTKMAKYYISHFSA